VHRHETPEGGAMRGIGLRSAGIVAMLGVCLAVARGLPATAHLGTPSHLWSEHVRPRADARYLQNTHVFVSGVFTLGIAADLTVTRLCPAGQQAIGGGVDFDDENADVQVISSAPVVEGTNLFAADPGPNPAAGGWRVTMHNAGLASVDGVVGAVCTR
jgi:hypothetical protein